MTRLVFNWPDEAGEAVRAARGRLDVAAERLAAKSFEERLRSVAGVVESWAAPDSPWRRELSALLANDSALHPRTLDEGLESALRAWDPVVFENCARREIQAASGSNGPRLVPYRCISVLAGGPIPTPTLLSGLLPLVLGSPVLLRETTKDSVTASLLARSIAARDDELAGCVEVVRFPVEDHAAFDAFLDSPCVVATGSDETIASIGSRLRANQHLVAHGHRFSVAILGADLVNDEAEFTRCIEGLALDVARWDQLGCLSPVVVYLVGMSIQQRREISERLAADLERISATMPRGGYPAASLASHAQERDEARMRAAVEGDVILHEGSDFAVVLEKDTRPRPAPLLRFLRLAPVDTLENLGLILSDFSRHLSSAAVAGFDASQTPALRRLQARSGIHRITSPGRLQTPPIDWPHDGRPVFLPLARFFQWDSFPR